MRSAASQTSSRQKCLPRAHRKHGAFLADRRCKPRPIRNTCRATSRRIILRNRSRSRQARSRRACDAAHTGVARRKATRLVHVLCDERKERPRTRDRSFPFTALVRVLCEEMGYCPALTRGVMMPMLSTPAWCPKSMTSAMGAKSRSLSPSTNITFSCRDEKMSTSLGSIAVLLNA